MGWLLIGGNKDKEPASSKKTTSKKKVAKKTQSARSSSKSPSASSKKKSTKKTAKKTTKKAAVQEVETPTTGPFPALITFWRPALVLALVVLIAGGWVLGRNWLKSEVGALRTQSDFKILIKSPVTPDTPKGELPAWMTQDWKASLYEQVMPESREELYVMGNPMNQETLVSLAADLKKSAWVEKVERVERDRQGNISIVADFREPVAVVRSLNQDEYHLIDKNRRVLPAKYLATDVETLRLAGLVVIENTAIPPAKQGEVWMGDDLIDGLALAALLVKEKLSNQVLSIDVRNHDGSWDRHDAHLSFTTENGKIKWGRAPGKENTTEPGFHQKITHLRQVISRKGIFNLTTDETTYTDGGPVDHSIRNTTNPGSL